MPCRGGGGAMMLERTISPSPQVQNMVHTLSKIRVTKLSQLSRESPESKKILGQQHPHHCQKVMVLPLCSVYSASSCGGIKFIKGEGQLNPLIYFAN